MEGIARADDDGARIADVAVEAPQTGGGVELHGAVAGRFDDGDALRGCERDRVEVRLLPLDRAAARAGSIAGVPADTRLLLEQDDVTRTEL